MEAINPALEASKLAWFPQMLPTFRAVVFAYALTCIADELRRAKSPWLWPWK